MAEKKKATDKSKSEWETKIDIRIIKGIDLRGDRESLTGKPLN